MLQRKQISSPGVAAFRPGPVVQPARPRSPAPLTRIAPKPAPPRIGLVNARSIQRAEDDRYAKQNFEAMKAILAMGNVVEEDNQRLLSMSERDFVDPRVTKKFLGKDTTLTVIEVVAVHLAEQDFLRAIEKREPGFRERFVPVFPHVKKGMCLNMLWPELCGALGKRGLRIREAHVNARSLLPHVVNIPTVMSSCTSLVKWAWYGYAIENTLKADVPVQWAELMSGGITSRILYDWWNDIFFITPHYSDWEDAKAKLPSKRDVELAFDNPYVKLIGTSHWRARSDERQLREYRDEIEGLRLFEARSGADQRQALLKASIRYNSFASMLGVPKLSQYEVLLNPDREFDRSDLALVKARNKRFIPR